MSAKYRLDGMVIRDHDNNYICEIIGYERDGLNKLLNAEIEDSVIVPRGLLGSARYAILHKCDAPNTYTKLGEYIYPNGNTVDVDALITVDDATRTMCVDRDIKAANLQLLVEKVLAYCHTGSTQEDYAAMVELARGLKQ